MTPEVEKLIAELRKRAPGRQWRVHLPQQTSPPALESVCGALVKVAR
jgi:hypothetical protein